MFEYLTQADAELAALIERARGVTAPQRRRTEAVITVDASRIDELVRVALEERGHIAYAMADVALPQVPSRAKRVYDLVSSFFMIGKDAAVVRALDEALAVPVRWSYQPPPGSPRGRAPVVQIRRPAAGGGRAGVPLESFLEAA